MNDDMQQILDDPGSFKFELQECISNLQKQLVTAVSEWKRVEGIAGDNWLRLAACQEREDRWKNDYLEAVDKHNLTLDEFAKVSADWIKTQYDLAASQAREKVLRDALDAYRGQIDQYGKSGLAERALAQHPDDTALRERLKAEREWCAKVCKQVSDSLNDEYPDDPSLKFAADECFNAVSVLGDK